MNNKLNNEKSIVLPLVALGLVSLPFIFSFFNSIGIRVPMYSLFTILSPMVGCIVGIAALQKKNRISSIGKIIAIIAVVLPLAFVALVIIFFIGAATGLISLM